MKTVAKLVRSLWVEFPSLDIALSAVLAIAAASFGISGRLASSDMLSTFLEASATASGLVLAAATFVCTMTYQSSSVLMTQIRRKFGHDIAHAWIFIISTTLLSCIATVFLLALPSNTLVATIALGLLALPGLEGLRSVWWLRNTLFVQDTDEKRSDLAHPKIPEFSPHT